MQFHFLVEEVDSDYEQVHQYNHFDYVYDHLLVRLEHTQSSQNANGEETKGKLEC